MGSVRMSLVLVMMRGQRKSFHSDTTANNPTVTSAGCAIGNTTIDLPIPNAIEGTVWLLLKVLVFLYVYVWFRATLPRSALRPVPHQAGAAS